MTVAATAARALSDTTEPGLEYGHYRMSRRALRAYASRREEVRMRSMAIALVIAAAVALPTAAASRASEQRDAVKKVQESSTVLTQVMGTGEKAIPKGLLNDAEC